METREVYEARRERVAARITADPTLFNMCTYITQTECGTVACIAGHTALQMQEEGLGDVRVYGGMPEAQYLGLLDSTAEINRMFSSFAEHRTAEEAALALKSAPYCTDVT